MGFSLGETEKDTVKHWQTVALVVSSALLLAFSFPPFRFGFMAYFGFLPFFILLENMPAKSAFWWGYLWGIIFHSLSLYWLTFITWPGAVGAVLFLSLYFGLFALVAAVFHRHWGWKAVFWYPFIWVGIEFVKSLGVIGFPWFTIGYTQTYYTHLIQFADITGVFGVSFWILCLNGVFLLLFRNWRNWKKSLFYLGVLALLSFLPWLYSQIVLRENNDFKDYLRVGVIQGNIDPFEKWDETFLAKNFAIYEKLTRKAAREASLDLIVWPETATACYLRSRPEYLNRVRRLVDSLNVALLTGTPDYRFRENGNYDAYNAIFLFVPHTAGIQYYYKMHLVPFGERVPFSERFPILEKWFDMLNTGAGAWTPGNEYVLFDLPGTYLEKRGLKRSWQPLRFAGLICYESIFQEQVRKFVQRGAQFLTIVTNDAWFGHSAAPFQHAQIAVFRAVENHVSVVRCANTGVSMFIDPFGRVLKETNIFQPAILVARIPIQTKKTFFSKHGDLFVYLISGLAGFELLWMLIARRAGRVEKSV